MNANELREGYQKFFEGYGHQRIPSAPLLPENDPTVLFTTAGMHPLVPFLLGEPHSRGRRLVDVQRCLRTSDIDEVGDISHLTFFEMLGNWSLGDYFKEESLAWSCEFLTRQLGIPPASLAVTVFAGDATAPRDELSAGIWRSLGISAERIVYLPKTDNWWGPAGNSGPCGPDSEIFYDTGRPDHPGCAPGCRCGKWLEIWNNVFMEYNKTADGSYVLLRQKNVDTGMGVDRTMAVLQGNDDIFKIETLWPVIERLQELSGRGYDETPRPFRLIADHIRAASLAIADGAHPSNVEAGYVVRRLVRRAVRYARQLGIREHFCAELSNTVLEMFAPVYPEVAVQRQRAAIELGREEEKFAATLERGLHEYHKVAAGLKEKHGTTLSGVDAFRLFDTFGFPLALTVEIAGEERLTVDEAGFTARFEEHRKVSRDSLENKFKGGLADHTEETTRLHTTSHLLQQALRRVLGPSVQQMGSNITAERLRFDFSWPEKLTAEQIDEIEAIINQQIAFDLPVTMAVMPLSQAQAEGALAFFGEKYGDQVKVYSIGAFSKEVCGGPHVSHTGALGRFKITKQEAVGQGVRRVRAVLEVVLL
jgi:alanyl-tRNA synthetase